MKYFTFLLILGLAGSGNFSFGNKIYGGNDTLMYAPADWFNLDPEKDNCIGVSTNRAYNELLKGKKSSKVVVAILDSGVDFNHEDLKGHIWTNTGEIPGNGIDDDKNGYIDDVHGWNFIEQNEDTEVKHGITPSTASVPGDNDKTTKDVVTSVTGENAAASVSELGSAERFYGNSSVAGPGANHGTHVSGIVAASRINNEGINGIAENVEIMILRVVPDGHEKDRDVANAVFYAVNNGAKIINMSFGKDYTTDKEYVDQAVRYAETNNVLIVHAAGNYSDDNDAVTFYPSRNYKSGGQCKSWIEVGAVSWENGASMVASFTNYGKSSVDLFAPGVDIRSTIPDQKYRKLNGTSMAAPMVTGVAALVWSYYPQLSACELKSVLLESTVKPDVDMVFLPGDSSKKVHFSDLCSTGGVVNAFKALKLAEQVNQ